MKLLGALLLLASFSLQAKIIVKLENDDMIRMHSNGIEGISGFIRANGFKETTQQQQQQHNGCYIAEDIKELWSYAEVMTLSNVMRSGYFTSKRSSTEGPRNKDELEQALITLDQASSNNTFKIKCTLKTFNLNLRVNYQPRQPQFTEYLDQTCFSLCVANESGNCESKCRKYQQQQQQQQQSQQNYCGIQQIDNSLQTYVSCEIHSLD